MSVTHRCSMTNLCRARPCAEDSNLSFEICHLSLQKPKQTTHSLARRACIACLPRLQALVEFDVTLDHGFDGEVIADPVFGCGSETLG